MNNNRHYPTGGLLLLIVIILLGSLSQRAYSQNSTTPSTSGLDIGFSSNFEKFNYIDPIGLRLISELNTPSATVDPKVYVLGPNDLISMKIDGNFSLAIRGVAVNAEGDLILPQIGDVYVSGLTITQAHTKLDSVITKTFKDSYLSYLSLDKPRDFYVTITGNIPNPGRFEIPAMSRLDAVIKPALSKSQESLQQATGSTQQPFLMDRVPLTRRAFTKMGRTDTTLHSSYEFDQGNLLQNYRYDFRNILIRHTDGTTTRADLVNYSRTGDLSGNPVVRDGDVIQIYKIDEHTPRISISGAVNIPSELEYRKGDTISKLIQLAGGYSTLADTTRVIVYSRKGTGIDSVSIATDQPNFDTFKLEPNERVQVPTLPNAKMNYSAWVYGEVKNPGNYPIVEGHTTAQDLVKLAGGLKSDALPQAAYMLRSKTGFSNKSNSEINTDLLKRTSNQYIQGLEYLDLETRLSEGRINLNASDIAQMSNINVLDGDRLFIPRDNHTVFLFGQVNNPGYFTFKSNVSVEQYIHKAGGLALAADPGRIFVIKAGSRTWYKPDQTTLGSGDYIFVDRKPYEELSAQRQYQIQLEAAKRGNIQLILAGFSAITAIITTLIAVKVL